MRSLISKLFIIVFAWYGGKIRFAMRLLGLVPKCHVWCEPYMGSAALTLNHIRCNREILNDTDYGLVCFFKTLQDKRAGKELIEQIKSMNCSEEEFEAAKSFKESWDKNQEGKKPQYISVERALCEFILITQSFNNTRNSYSKKNLKKVQGFRKRSVRNLTRAQERLENVEIRHGNALDVIRELKDNEDAFLFLDPPYEHDKRNASAIMAYGEGNEMSQKAHRELVELIKDAKCKIILSGYRFDDVTEQTLYDRYLLPYGWKCYKLADTKKTAAPSKNGKKPPAKEFIWVNYTMSDFAGRCISLREYGAVKGD